MNLGEIGLQHRRSLYRELPRMGSLCNCPLTFWSTGVGTRGVEGTGDVGDGLGFVFGVL
ncbi:hypothetical protein [Desulfosporosinus nitroreducens]|uniref:Uncharacterized protein n=1 Tax=Desulfosporosinus nitroreducens TaxID=2018668 RepID=A0ABT8QYG6_9FIRM|nr:hypothetical protein [Desulfosporosinus nitroreducens]MDO0825599.1 hypothetical protein [Desulfosporosinus nitroreducens]